jgi:hypothetical protein
VRRFRLALLLLGAALTQPDGIGSTLAPKAINIDGWLVPGLDWTRGHSPTTDSKRIEVDGQTVIVTRFLPPQRKAGKPALSRLPLIFLDGSAAILRVRDFVVGQIDRYQLNGRPFCYVVTVRPYSYDRLSRQGGVVALEMQLAFYDDDGDGKFETMEPVNSILGGKEQWRIRLPAPPLSRPPE